MTLPPSIQRLFERSSIALTLADARRDDQPLVLVNRAFCALTGYALSDITDRNCRFLQGPETSVEARAEVRAAIEGGFDTQVRITNYARTGRKFDNLLFLYTLRDAASVPIYFLGSQFEISRLATVTMLDEHMRTLDHGIAALVSDVRFEQIRTRRILSDAAAGTVRTQLMKQAITG
jgi:PAS domain S-box-containing protein